MTTMGRVYQGAVLSYCAYSVAQALTSALTWWPGPIDRRVAMLLVAAVAVQAVIAWLILVYPKSGSLVLGIFFTVLAIARVVRYVQHQGPRLSVGDLPITMPTTKHVVLIVLVLIICALACFGLRKELTKLPNQSPQPTPPTGC